MATTITRAECPDCGSFYVWHASEGVFRCEGCTAPDFHTLAPSDVYLEHNETWATANHPCGHGTILVIVTTEEG